MSLSGCKSLKRSQRVPRSAKQSTAEHCRDAGPKNVGLRPAASQAWQHVGFAAPNHGQPKVQEFKALITGARPFMAFSAKSSSDLWPKWLPAAVIAAIVSNRLLHADSS